jgi:type II secretory pathway pseudopilin PulG
MGLRDQYAERGYAMAALLIALAIMAILLTVAMPVWRQEARREREAELVFRGEQYARAVALFRFKNANIPNAFPPSIDSLVQGRFLRKKYKDPMTKDGEFELIGVGSQQPGINPTNPAQPTARGNTPLQPTGVAGGMMGVRSKSQDTSIRAYRGATRYDQWAFTFNIAPRPGGAMPMANTADGGRGTNPTNPNTPGARGQRGTNPGQRGRGTDVGPGGFPPPTQGPAGGNRGLGPGGRGRGF